MVGPVDPLLCTVWAAREHERGLSANASAWRSSDEPVNDLETLLLGAAIDTLNRRGTTLVQARLSHAKRLAQVAGMLAPKPNADAPEAVSASSEVHP